MGDRDKLCQGLRELATFLETHHEIPLPPWGVSITGFVGSRDELRAACRNIGTAEKHWYGATLSIRKNFGPVSLDIDISREKVCKRVVKGQEWIPPSVGHHQDVIEWVCDEPIFAGDGGLP